MRSLVILAFVLASGTTVAGEKLYKCKNAEGKIEYTNVVCAGTPEVFDPKKGKGSVTNVKMPKVEAPAEAQSKPAMDPEQKGQMDQLGIKPIGTPKSLVIPQSWLK